VTQEKPHVNKPSHSPAVIRRDAVRFVPQAALLDCSAPGDDQASKPLAIVPLLDGDRIAGFEVRCGCGAAAMIECVYEDTPP
jgi:hypothetical protein